MSQQPFSHVESRALLLLVDNIDTDQIIPARFLKTTDKLGLGAQLFADWRYDEAGNPREDFVLNQPGSEGAEILVAGYNFGCGSSREHAPWALVGCGFRVVVSAKFADIFYNNALKNGLLPVQLTSAEVAEIAAAIASDPSLRLSVDLDRQELRLAGSRVYRFAIDSFARHCLLAGVDELGYLLAQDEAIRAYEGTHPSRFDARDEAAPGA